MKRLQLLEAYERQRLTVGAGGGDRAHNAATAAAPPQAASTPAAATAAAWGCALTPLAPRRTSSVSRLIGWPRSSPCVSNLLQELQEEEDRIYAQWMKAAEGAAQEARLAYHARRREQLMEVRGWGRVALYFGCTGEPPGEAGERAAEALLPAAGDCSRSCGGAQNSAHASVSCPSRSPQEARAVVAERRGAALNQITQAQAKEGVFGWPEGVPEAGERGRAVGGSLHAASQWRGVQHAGIQGCPQEQQRCAQQPTAVTLALLHPPPTASHCPPLQAAPACWSTTRLPAPCATPPPLSSCTSATTAGGCRCGFWGRAAGQLGGGAGGTCAARWRLPALLLLRALASAQPSPANS